MGTTNTDLLFDYLNRIRELHGYEPQATLPAEIIKSKVAFNQNLRIAIIKSAKVFDNIKTTFPELLKLPELEAIKLLRSNVLNFYPEDSGSPYIAIASQGPWIVTFHGGVIYTCGGYGILGFGHNPDFILEVLAKEQTMANIMTPNISQYRFTRALLNNIGFSKPAPYEKFALMNTGSEAVSVAARISDAHAKTVTEHDQIHFGKEIKYLALLGGFHGRTYDAAQASSSSYKAYQATLASFRNSKKLVTVIPNDLESLENAFIQAEKDNVYFEMMFIEPVMGEGRAGFAITPEFYALARKLTQAHKSLLLVDSIQAGLRCHGVLSINDYPGFEKLEGPDMETFSKAINCGQYPLSVLAINSYTADFYKTGIYGNTMTGNPRGLDLGAAVLNQMTPAVRANIINMGVEFKNALEVVQAEFPEILEEVLGQGLLLSAKINPKYPVEGLYGIEHRMRLNGVNVIHSSGNRLRFTPWFLINKEEIILIQHCLRQVLKNL